MTKKILLYTYFLSLIIVGNRIFPFWSVVLTVWIFGFFLIYRLKLIDQLERRERTIINWVGIGYPLIETVIKAAIIYNWMPYSWNWLNRIEHFGFSFAICFMIYPFIKKDFSKSNLFTQILLIVGIVSILGNLNEIVEYILRVAWSLEENFATYYWDSIFDIVINTLGGLAGFIAIKLIFRHDKENIKVPT